MLEILSPSAEVTVPKTQKSFATTPKRRRMANVLDVLETVKTLNSTPSKEIVEASKAQTEVEIEQTEIETTVIQAGAKAGPSESAEINHAEIEEKATEEKTQSKFRLKRLPLLLPKL